MKGSPKRIFAHQVAHELTAEELTTVSGAWSAGFTFCGHGAHCPDDAPPGVDLP